MVEKEMRWKADVKLEAGDAWNGDVQRDCPGVDTDTWGGRELDRTAVS